MTEEPLTCNRAIEVCDNILHHYRKTVAELKQLRLVTERSIEVLVTLKGTIDGYIRDEWDGNLEGWQCASDNIAALGIKSEWEEEE